MSKVKRIFLFLLLLTIFMYVTNITAMPKNLVLFKGERAEFTMLPGLSALNTKEIIQTDASINGNSVFENTKVSLKLFNLIKVKEIDVNVIPNTTVIPLGNSARVKALYKWCTNSRIKPGSRNKTI